MSGRTKPPEKHIWLTHEEIVEMESRDLRAALNKTYANMTDMQHKLVTCMLSGKHSDSKSARLAGYSQRETNPGWRARKTKIVVQALAIGREIAARGAAVTAEFVRTELQELLIRAKAEGDNLTVTKCISEICKIDGLYAAEQMKLNIAGHDGGPLVKDITEEEWLALASLQHDLRTNDVIEGECEVVEVPQLATG